MGLFGGQTKQEPVTSTSYEGDMFEEPFDALPTLPKAQDNTVIAKGITFTGTIHGEGVVRVEGRVEGEVDLKGTASLIVENGRLDGSSTMLTAPERPKEPDLSVDDLQFGENYDLDLGSEQ